MFSAPWIPTTPEVLETLVTNGGEIALRTWFIVIFGVICLIMAGIGSYKLVKVSKNACFCFKIGFRVKKSYTQKALFGFKNCKVFLIYDMDYNTL
jgi:hypothetical protein